MIPADGGTQADHPKDITPVFVGNGGHHPEGATELWQDSLEINFVTNVRIMHKINVLVNITYKYFTYCDCYFDTIS